MIPCERLAATWLPLDPKSPRKAQSTILNSFGADIGTDFEVVEEIQTAEDAEGYKKTRLQLLLKPIRPVDAALAACIATRTITP